MHSTTIDPRAGIAIDGGGRSRGLGGEALARGHGAKDLEIWLAELDGIVAGWGAIRGGYLEGLYTAPEFAGRGVGGDLLDMLERLMHGRGIAVVEARASSNALVFYLRRGYRENGPRAGNGAWPIAKTLQPAP